MSNLKLSQPGVERSETQTGTLNLYQWWGLAFTIRLLGRILNIYGPSEDMADFLNLQGKLEPLTFTNDEV